MNMQIIIKQQTSPLPGLHQLRNGEDRHNGHHPHSQRGGRQPRPLRPYASVGVGHPPPIHIKIRANVLCQVIVYRNLTRCFYEE